MDRDDNERGDPGKWLPLSDGFKVRLSGRASEQVGIALQIQRPTLVAGNTVAHALPAAGALVTVILIVVTGCVAIY
jgi:hypothetical protein